jgi:transposase
VKLLSFRFHNKEHPMLYAGCDLHKQTISVCIMNPARQIVRRERLLCVNEEAIHRFFEELGEFEAVVEATASYEWFVRLIEPLAHRVVLAHPKKLRVIAESTRKSDKLDAQVLAEFLALDMVPASYRPTPRQREHRQLVRQRDRIQRRITSVKNRIRRLLADYNADRQGLFSAEGLAFLRKLGLSAADRFTMNQLLEEYDFQRRQLKSAEQQIEAFVATGPVRERELRTLLRTIPGVGFVTTEVILAELADITRFRSQSQVVAYAGLAPGQRESAGKTQELHLEKTGSKLLRSTMVEAAWRLVRHSPRWKGIFEKLKGRIRSKKAIVAIARRQLTLVAAILKTGQPYSASYVPSQAAA